MGKCMSVWRGGGFKSDIKELENNRTKEKWKELEKTPLQWEICFIIHSAM